MRSKILVPTWREHSKEICNAREHPEKPFRSATPSFLFTKGNSNKYGERTADKNDAATDDP